MSFFMHLAQSMSGRKNARGSQGRGRFRHRKIVRAHTPAFRPYRNSCRALSEPRTWDLRSWVPDPEKLGTLDLRGCRLILRDARNWKKDELSICRLSVAIREKFFLRVMSFRSYKKCKSGPFSVSLGTCFFSGFRRRRRQKNGFLAPQAPKIWFWGWF